MIANNRQLQRCGKRLPRYCDINNDRKISMTEWFSCLNAQRPTTRNYFHYKYVYLVRLGMHNFTTIRKIRQIYSSLKFVNIKLFQLKVRKNHQRVNPREWAQIRWINFLKTTMIRSICDMNVCSSFYPYVVVIIHPACG